MIISNTKNTREKEAYKVTLVGFFVNLLLVIGKLFAGIVGRSGAMVADAIHSLSDFATDVIVIVFIGLSSKPNDKDHKYGHGKYETLATAIISIILLVVGLALAWSGAHTIYTAFMHGVFPQKPGVIALYAAIVSIISKEWLFRYTNDIGRRINSQAVIANGWHHRSDALSSVGTLIGIGGAILLGNKWTLLDPLAALIVSYFICKVALRIFKPSMGELLESSLPENDEEKILEIVRSNVGVVDPHGLRTRRIGNNIAVEVHIRVEPERTVQYAHDITRNIENQIRAEFGAQSHVNIHVEPIKEPIS